jgi:tetratricopeptide (TPR) repeat protein
MFGFGFTKEKSRAAAERYLQQNKLPNAITEYEKILAVEPRDLAILNQVGDIYARLGQNEKAIERFRVVAESYATDGFNLKSIAMYKKITKLDPNGLAAMEKLAELYRKQGLVSDARSMLLQAAEAYTRRNQSKETLRLLKQLVLFDPENVQVISRTADLMIQGQQKNDAKEMLSQTASTLVERHALEPAQKILDKLIALDRSNLRAQELRAQVTLELGNAEKAAELYEAIPDLDSRIDGLRNLLAALLRLGKLDNAYPVARKLVAVHHDAEGIRQVAACLYKENEVLPAIAIYEEFSTELLAHDKEDMLAHLHGAVSRVRTNPDALQSIYSLFQRAGETSMFAEVLELLAHACVQSEQLERARDAYKELIGLEPESPAHIQAYRQVCARLDPNAPVPVINQAKPQEKLNTLEDFLTSDEPELPSQAYPPEVEEIVTGALGEAELYESFASKTQSITVLEAALQSAPDDLRLNRILGLLYRQEGDSSKSARCYNTVQRVLESFGDTSGATYYANLTSSGQTVTWEAKGSEFAAADFDITPDNALGGTEEIDLSGEWESVWEDNPADQPPAPAAAGTQAEPASSVEELLDEARFCIAQQIWGEAVTAIARLAQLCPEHPELPALRAQLQAGSALLGSAGGSPLAQPGMRETTQQKTQPSAPPNEFPMMPAEPILDSMAAELDMELGDGFVPAAQSRRESTPSLPRAAAPVAPPTRATGGPAPASGGRSVGPYPTAPAPTAGRPTPEQVPYMAAAAAETHPDLTPSVFGDLLSDFERDLAAPQDVDNDPETHFSLGMAFRDMGLLDEAIGELQKVCRLAGNGLTPARTQQAYIWLATCFVEKSVPEASFKWFLRALETAPDDESRTAVNYELASAYEAAGRKREALDHFLEVYGSNIDYRDIAIRIRNLRAAV